MRTIAAYHHATLTRDDPSIECEQRLRLNQKIQSGLLVDVLIAPSDPSEMFKSVFLLISAIAVSSARWRKFAQTVKALLG
jgi:hypothetical protein